MTCFFLKHVQLYYSRSLSINFNFIMGNGITEASHAKSFWPRRWFTHNRPQKIALLTDSSACGFSQPCPFGAFVFLGNRIISFLPDIIAHFLSYRVFLNHHRIWMFLLRSNNTKTWSASNIQSVNSSIVPVWIFSIIASRPNPRAFAQLPQVATYPRPTTNFIIRSIL